MIKNILKKTIASLLSTVMLTTSVFADGSNSSGSGFPVTNGGGTAGDFPTYILKQNAISIHINKQEKGVFYKTTSMENLFGCGGMPFAKNDSNRVLPFIYTPSASEKDMFISVDTMDNSTSFISTINDSGMNGMSKVVHVKGGKYTDVENYILKGIPNNVYTGFVNNVTGSEGVPFSYDILKKIGLSESDAGYKKAMTMNKNGAKVGPNRISKTEFKEYINGYIKDKKFSAKSKTAAKMLGLATWAAAIAKYQGYDKDTINDIMLFYMGEKSKYDYPIIINDYHGVRFKWKVNINGKGPVRDVYIQTTGLLKVMQDYKGQGSSWIASGSNNGIVKLPPHYINKQPLFRPGGKYISSSLDNVKDHWSLMRELGFIGLAVKNGGPELTGLGRRYLAYRDEFVVYDPLKKKENFINFPDIEKPKSLSSLQSNPIAYYPGFHIIMSSSVAGPPVKETSSKDLHHDLTGTFVTGDLTKPNLESPTKLLKLKKGGTNKVLVAFDYKPKLTTSPNYKDFKSKLVDSAKWFEDMRDFVIAEKFPNLTPEAVPLEIELKFQTQDMKFKIDGTSVKAGKIVESSKPRFSTKSIEKSKVDSTDMEATVPVEVNIKATSSEDLSKQLDKELGKVNQKFTMTNGLVIFEPSIEGTESVISITSEGIYNFTMKVTIKNEGVDNIVQEELHKTNKTKEQPIAPGSHFSKWNILGDGILTHVGIDKSRDELKIITDTSEEINVNWWSNPHAYGEFKNESSAHTKPHSWDVFQGIPHDRNVELNLGNSPFAVNIGATFKTDTLEETIEYSIKKKVNIHFREPCEEEGGGEEGEGEPENLNEDEVVGEGGEEGCFVCHGHKVKHQVIEEESRTVGPGSIAYWNINYIDVSFAENSIVKGTMDAKAQADQVKVFDDITYKSNKLTPVRETIQKQDITTYIDTYTLLNNGHEYKLRILKRVFSEKEHKGFSEGIGKLSLTGTPDSSDGSQNYAELKQWAQQQYWYVNSDGLSLELYKDGKRVQVLDVLIPFSIKKYLDNGLPLFIENENPPSAQFEGYDIEKPGLAATPTPNKWFDCTCGSFYIDFDVSKFELEEQKFPLDIEGIKRFWYPNDVTKPADPIGEEGSLSEEGDVFKVLWSHNHTIPVIGYQGMQNKEPYEKNNEAYVLGASGIEFKPFTDVKTFYKIFQLGNPIVQNDHYSFTPNESYVKYSDWNRIHSNLQTSVPTLEPLKPIEYKYLDEIRNKNWQELSIDTVVGAEANQINPIIIHTPVATTAFTIRGDSNSDLPDQRLNRIKKGEWYGKDLETAFHEYSDVYYSGSGPVPRTTIDRTYSVSWTNKGNYDQEGFKDDMPNGKEEFYRKDMVSESGDYVGISYLTDMDTSPWIKEQYVLIPFHHIIDGKYYKGGTIHKKSAGDNNITFTIAPNQTDLKNATISVYAVSTNAPDSELVKGEQLGVIEIGKGDVQGFTTSGQHHTNDVNDSREGATNAKHHSYTQLRHDIVGRIGNLNVDEVEDPNYQNLFRKEDKYSMQDKDIFNDKSKPYGANNTGKSNPHHTKEKQTKQELPITNEHIGKDKNNLPKLGYGVGFNFQTIGSYWAENIYIKPNFLIDGSPVDSMTQKLSTTTKEKIYKDLDTEFWVKHNLGSQYQKYDKNDRLYNKEQDKLMKINRNVAKIMNLGNATKLTLSKEHNRMPILDAESILELNRGSDSTTVSLKFDKSSKDKILAANNHSRWVGKFNLPSSTEVYDSNGKIYPLSKPITFEANITTGLPEYIIPEGTDGYHEAPDWVLNLTQSQPNTTAPEVGDGSPSGPINPPCPPESSKPGQPIYPPTEPPKLPDKGTTTPGEPNKIIIWIRKLTSADDLQNVGTH